MSRGAGRRVPRNRSECLSVELLLATGNRHKLDEIQAILADLPFVWKSTQDWPNATEVSEDGDTYDRNALLKAKIWSERSGLWTLADDSGLEVDALDGRPGVRSARYAGPGEDQIDKLLGELRGVAPDARTARFVCTCCLVSPDGDAFSEHGELRGRIALERKGDGGFGYDPVFVPDEYGGLHLAELPADIKNRISHRARALAALRPKLNELRGE